MDSVKRMYVGGAMKMQDGFYLAKLNDGSVEVVDISDSGVMRTGVSGRYLQCEFNPDFGPNPKPIEKPEWLK